MSTVRLTGTTSGYVELTAPAVAGDNSLTLPTGNGTADQRLVTDGSGALSFSSDVMLAAGSAGSPSLYFSGDTNTGMWSPDADTLAWSTGGSERMRITNSGNFRIGQTTTAVPGFGNTAVGVGFDNAAKIIYASSDSSSGLRVNRNSDGQVIAFRRSGSAGSVGSINVTTSSTSFVTSSDYRLKENVVDLDGAIDRLKLLPVYRFNFKADPDTVVDGFIAHEAAEVVPECVTGTKDEVDEDGNPVYQGIDQSKIVPLLTAALQEAIGKIETLESRLAALEANQ